MKAKFVNEAFERKSKEQSIRNMIFPEKVKDVLGAISKNDWEQFVATNECKKKFENDLITVWMDSYLGNGYTTYVRIGINYYIMLADDIDVEDDYIWFLALDSNYRQLDLKIDKETGYPELSEYEYI